MIMKKISKISAMAGLAATLTLGPVLAQADEGGWEFSVAPLYLWAKNIEGVTTAGGKDLPLELDFKDDILENLDSAFAIHMEATNGSITFFAEYNYAKLDPTVENYVGPVRVQGDVDFKDTMMEGGMAWTFADARSTQWEVLGGLRYYDQDVTIKFSNDASIETPLPNRLEVGDSWMQPFLGVRTTTILSKRWSLRLRADYGYEGADNTALQGLAFIDYRFRDWGSAFFGYRYLDMDFDNGIRGLDQYAIDGNQQGPLIGLNFHF